MPTPLEQQVAQHREYVTQRHGVLEYVVAYPGKTSAELSAIKADFLHNDATRWKEYRDMFARRLPELAPLQILKGGQRKCSVSGKTSLTWWPK